jgi:S-adenosylmethionine uptake transporter
LSATLRAYLAACIGIASYSVMDVVMKGLAIGMGAYAALFWRSVAGLGVTGALYAAHWPGRPGAGVVRIHAARGAVVTAMALAFFWGIVRVPLAEAIALTFVAPLIALALAATVLGERVGRRAIGASLLGLAGVAVILAGRLGTARGPEAAWGAGAVLLSALLYAVNLVMARHQAQRAGPVEIAFWQNLFVLLFLLPGAAWLVVTPALRHWPAIGAAAGLAAVSILLLSWAYARAEAQMLLSVEYTAFLWAALFGWLAFGERLTAVTVAGTVLIVGGCLLAARTGEPEVA